MSFKIVGSKTYKLFIYEPNAIHPANAAGVEYR